MPWWGAVLVGWLAPCVLLVLYAAGLVAFEQWRLAASVEQTDREWAARNGIDMNTVYPNFLPGERLP